MERKKAGGREIAIMSAPTPNSACWKKPSSVTYALPPGGSATLFWTAGGQGYDRYLRAVQNPPMK
jgi:hypothetical protein